MQSNIKYLGIVLLSLAIIALLLWLIRGEQRRSLQVTATAKPASEDEGFQLELPQKALWRNYVHVAAEASPGTTCELIYIPPSGDSQELFSEANEGGKCTWRWKIEETDGKGNARLIFTIDGKSETHFIEIRRSF